MSKTELLGRDEIVGDSGLYVDGDGQIVRGCEMRGPLTSSQRRSFLKNLRTRRGHHRLPFGPPRLGNNVGSFVGRDEIVGDDSSLDLEEIMGSFVGDDASPHDRALNQLIELYNRSVTGDKEALQAFGRVMSRLTSESQAGNLRAKKLLTRLVQSQAQSMQGDDVGASVLKKLEGYARKGLTAPFTATSWTSRQIAQGLRALPSPFDMSRVFRSHVPGGTFVGRDEIVGSFTSDDDLALASEGSHADRAALARHARSSSGYNSHWRYMRGDDRPTGEALEELKTRAAAGDLRSIQRLAKLRKSTSGHDPTRQRPPAPSEKNLIVKVRSAQERAQAGDVSAQRQLTELRKEIPGLLSRAQAGDEQARRHLLILKKLGVAQTS